MLTYEEVLKETTHKKEREQEKIIQHMLDDTKKTDGRLILKLEKI